MAIPLYPHIPKRRKREHEWGVVAQCKNPYREFLYCPLCNQYEESGTGQRMTKREFRKLSLELSSTLNPMYEADSSTLLGWR
jgi:hypothetical protein